MNMTYIPLRDIVSKLEIKKGDILLISSDMKRLLYQALEEEGKTELNVLIEAFMEAVGEEGTLLFPTFNWDFCKGIAFDYKKTPCKTGALAKTALKRADFIRTKHPIYSFAVWGRDARQLYQLENKSSFGADSPFAYLHKMGARNLIIDVSYQHCFTFVHYVEEMTTDLIQETTRRVAYRYLKEFTADYIDENESKSKRTYSMFVRDLALEVFNTIEPMDEIFAAHQAVKKSVINGIEYKLVDLSKAYPLIQEDILYNKSRRLCHYLGQ